MFTGEQIKKKRKGLGWSAETLADHLKVKKDNIYKWEKGTRPIDPEEYKRVENWLSGKVENVPKGEDEPKKNDVEDAIAKGHLERALDNLTEDKLRSTAIIERLMTLLENSYDPRLPKKGQTGTESGGGNKKPAVKLVDKL